MQRLISIDSSGILSPFLDTIPYTLSSPSPLPSHGTEPGLCCAWASTWWSVTLCLPWKRFTIIFPFVGHSQALASFHCMTQLSNKAPHTLSAPEHPKIPNRGAVYHCPKTDRWLSTVLRCCGSWWRVAQLLYTCENGGSCAILPRHWDKTSKTRSPHAKKWASKCLYGAVISSIGAKHFVSDRRLRHFYVCCTASHTCMKVLERW